MNDDSNLREQFASLRRADAASAPSFERVIGIARRRSNQLEWRIAITACLLMVAVVGVILRVSHPTPGTDKSRIRAHTRGLACAY